MKIRTVLGGGATTMVKSNFNRGRRRILDNSLTSFAATPNLGTALNPCTMLVVCYKWGSGWNIPFQRRVSPSSNGKKD